MAGTDQKPTQKLLVTLTEFFNSDLLQFRRS